MSIERAYRSVSLLPVFRTSKKRIRYWPKSIKIALEQNFEQTGDYFDLSAWPCWLRGGCPLCGSVIVAYKQAYTASDMFQFLKSDVSEFTGVDGINSHCERCDRTMSLSGLPADWAPIEAMSIALKRKASHA